jgi:hypothetical protein
VSNRGTTSLKSTSSKAVSSKAARSCKAAGIGPSVVSVSPAVVPGACADKDSADKIVRAVVTVGRASIRIVGVIAISASWRASHIAGADADSNAYSNSCTHDDRSLRISERHSQ